MTAPRILLILGRALVHRLQSPVELDTGQVTSHVELALKQGVTAPPPPSLMPNLEQNLTGLNVESQIH